MRWSSTPPAEDDGRWVCWQNYRTGERMFYGPFDTAEAADAARERQDKWIGWTWLRILIARALGA